MVLGGAGNPTPGQQQFYGAGGGTGNQPSGGPGIVAIYELLP
jgi:hypothetical protein